MKNIFVDFDNVLVDWVSGFCDFLLNDGINLHKSDITYYEYISDYFNEYFNSFYQFPFVYGTYVDKFKGSVEFIDSLKKDFDVKIITNTFNSQECLSEKEIYIEKIFDIDRCDIIHSKRKYLYMDQDDILIDDKPHNCYQHSSYNNGLSILFNHNDDYVYCGKNKYLEIYGFLPIEYATSYDDILRIIKNEKT